MVFVPPPGKGSGTYLGALDQLLDVHIVSQKKQCLKLFEASEKYGTPSQSGLSLNLTSCYQET
jgi:hypothetical protein